MKPRILAVVLTTVLTLCLSLSSAIGGPVVDRILKKGVLTVGTTGFYPPLTVKSKSGEMIGLDMDIASMLSKAMGVKLKRVEMPIDKLFSAIEKGDIDLAMAGITITPKRNLRVMFSGPYFAIGQSILAHQSLVSKITGPDDINTKSFRLAVAKGTTSETIAKLIAPDATLISAANMEDAMNMVFEKKADAMLADEPFCVVAAFMHPAKKIAVSDPFTFEPLGIAMPQNDPLLFNIVDNFLMSLKANGKLKELKAYWFTDPSWMTELPERKSLKGFKKTAM